MVGEKARLTVFWNEWKFWSENYKCRIIKKLGFEEKRFVKWYLQWPGGTRDFCYYLCFLMEVIMAYFYYDGNALYFGDNDAWGMKG